MESTVQFDVSTMTMSAKAHMALFGIPKANTLAAAIHRALRGRRY